MKKKLQNNYNFKKLGFLLVIALQLFSSTSANAQFSANWPFTSVLGATVSGASSANVTASAATYTSGYRRFIYWDSNNHYWLTCWNWN
jgi:hypothetical protein